MSKFISVISGKHVLQDGRFHMSSSVKTDWNCSLNALVFALSDNAGKPDLVLRVGMLVLSLCKAHIYYQMDFGLSFTLAATISHV